MLGIEQRFSFPEDCGKESHDQFMKRLDECIAEWTGDAEIEWDIDNLEETIGDDEVHGYERFKKWLSIFEPDVFEFLNFMEANK